MSWFSELCNRVSSAATPPSGPEVTQTAHLTKTVIFGYRDSAVYFVDENRKIRKQLVDEGGNICRFPGILREDFWISAVSERALQPTVRFRTSFEDSADGWIMLWTLQPDGDYWCDESGFGGGNEQEVVLYTHVDLDGNYTGPFRIYQLGEQCYCLDRFEKLHAVFYAELLQKLRAGEVTERVTEELFPRLRGMGLHIGWRDLAEYFTFPNQAVAADYWAHPVLSQHLRESAQALLELPVPFAEAFPHPYSRIVQACMTLFASISGEPVFAKVLDRYFDGKTEEFTEKKLDG